MDVHDPYEDTPTHLECVEALRVAALLKGNGLFWWWGDHFPVFIESEILFKDNE